MARRIRTLLLLALVLLGTTSLFALPDHEIYFEYYKDDTYQTLVGERLITCFGIYQWGVQTPDRLVFHGPDC
ncbi:MAG TPA: hypothetical protein VFP80_18275 [Thermoanaerobaculia bacterium]|nr:hypothetical protein [Thermoanaerobaculia bacterium]